MTNKHQNEETDAKLPVTDPFNEIVSSAYKDLLDSRIILLNGEIDESIIERVLVPINTLAVKSSTKPITLLINSYGGSSDDAMAIVDAIQYTKTPITTIALGKAMSAAFDIFLAGDNRLVHENSILMCHSGQESISVKPLPFINDQAAFNAQLFKRWATYYASRTKMTYDAWYKIIESGRDHYFFSDQVLAKGIATEILSPAGKTLDLLSTSKNKIKKKRK